MSGRGRDLAILGRGAGWGRSSQVAFSPIWDRTPFRGLNQGRFQYLEIYVLNDRVIVSQSAAASCSSVTREDLSRFAARGGVYRRIT